MQKFKIPQQLTLLSAFAIIGLMLFALLRDTSEPITLREAINILENKSVKKVVATKEYVYLKSDDTLYKIASSQVNPRMFIDYEVEIETKIENYVYILLTLLLLGGGSILYRYIQKIKFLQNQTSLSGGQNSNDSGAIVEALKSNITFNDIGGADEVKMEFEEIIDFLKSPRKYKHFGARMPRGVLMVGPPGVGKTMIAKAVANAAGVPFFYQSGASFVQIYVGMGAKRVHELFLAAKNSAPSIVFIDEIDAVGKKRDGQRNDEREATLNQLLTEMDGFEGASNVIVIAATNKIDVLDDALLRAGRFDRRIFVELPTKTERENILQKYLHTIPNRVDIKEIANMSVGFNGAALAALVNEATLLCIRQKDQEVSNEHFHLVKDKVMFGKKKLQILNEEQKKFQVTYQAAKALLAAHFDLPFEKLMLSNERLTPANDTPLLKHELRSRVCVSLSGMVACEIRYKEHASSVLHDLNEAKELVKIMVHEYGMGSFLIAKQEDTTALLQEIYDETHTLLLHLAPILTSIEKILYEKESVKKSEIESFLHDFL